MNDEDLKLLRHKTAVMSIGPSTLRGQGVPHVAKRTREYLKRIRLYKYSVDSREDFLRIFNKETNRLKKSLPKGAQHWGLARKALNIFLRGVVYNRHLCSAYKLRKIEKYLEVPLDSMVGQCLHGAPEGQSLERWTTIKSLTKDKSDQYQEVAKKIARRKGTLPVHLDLHCFRREGARL